MTSVFEKVEVQEAHGCELRFALQFNVVNISPESFRCSVGEVAFAAIMGMSTEEVMMP